MIRSFNQFVFESEGITPNSTRYLDDVLNVINKISDPSDSYVEAGTLEYNYPYAFDLTVEVRLDSDPDFSTDEHFKKLPWEEINFNKYGFSIDANTMIDGKDNIIPKIVITVLINPIRRNSNDELKYRLIDIIQHELDHVLQMGWNHSPFSANPSDSNTRIASKVNYNYFLLPEEIEAMIGGIYKRSKEQGIPLDDLIIKYLTPFLQDNVISQDEFDLVLEEWLKQALSKYPDANISTSNTKVNKIVDSL